MVASGEGKPEFRHRGPQGPLGIWLQNPLEYPGLQVQEEQAEGQGCPRPHPFLPEFRVELKRSTLQSTF